jgi:hypothetical protein
MPASPAANRTPARGERVSMTVFAAPQRKPKPQGLIGDLHQWENPALKEDRLVISGMGANLYGMCEGVAWRAKKSETPISMDALLSWMERKGLIRMQSLRDVQVIVKARAAVLKNEGSDALVWFDTFPFEIPCGHSGRRTTWARVCAEDRRELAKLAGALGLTLSKTAQLVICSVLLDLPLSPDDHAFVQGVFTDFLARIKVRAREAQTRARAAVLATPPRTRVRRRSFADIKADMESGK